MATIKTSNTTRTLIEDRKLPAVKDDYSVYITSIRCISCGIATGERVQEYRRLVQKYPGIDNIKLMKKLDVEECCMITLRRPILRMPESMDKELVFGRKDTTSTMALPKSKLKVVPTMEETDDLVDVLPTQVGIPTISTNNISPLSEHVDTYSVITYLCR